MAAPEFSRIALIGFGEVGQTLGADLVAAGCRVSAFDPLFAVADSAPSRAQDIIRVAVAESPSAAVRDADLVISAVTAASDVDAARSVAPHIAPGTFYLDVNSVSPRTKVECGGVIGKAGGYYVEAAVMTPIAPKRSRLADAAGRTACPGIHRSGTRRSVSRVSPSRKKSGVLRPPKCVAA